MNWKDIDKEFDLLNEYLKIYIQLLPECVQCGGNIIHKPQLPTFEYFKKTYNDTSYSLVIPHYKESKAVYNQNCIGSVHTHGIGSTNGIAYRYYNIWMGCKFFTGGNTEGDYTIETGAVNQILKQL
jgi:hypothetical protein